MNRHFPLILAHLSATDMQLFHQAGITYTGATGRWSTFPDGCYIATYLSELVPALRAMGWAKARLRLRSDELIVRRIGVRRSEQRG